MAEQATSDLTIEGLVHDLNNVFDTISEAADLLEKDPAQKRLASAIRRGVIRGDRILSSFHASALAAQDFDGVLANAIEFARDLFGSGSASPVEFTTSVEPGLRLRGSPAAWERVLLNLFINAAQAMPEGSVVEIRAHGVEGATEIIVADNGPGIPDEVLPRIFQPHFSTKSSSTGLGLHIVESIVSANGGTVCASNRADSSGASFCIRLPDN